MKIFWRIILALGIIIALVVAYFLVFVYFKPHVNYLKAEVDIEIAGEQLYREFVDDPLQAAKTYNGKVLLVEGVVENIDYLDDMTIAVMIYDDGFFGKEGIRFTLLEGQEKYLLTGRLNRLKGYCTGFTGADVILEHASVP